MNKKVSMSKKALEERFFNRYSKLMEECQMWTNERQLLKRKNPDNVDEIEEYTKWINDSSVEANDLIEIFVEVVLDCEYNKYDKGFEYFKVKQEFEEKFWHKWYNSSNEIKKVLEVK